MASVREACTHVVGAYGLAAVCADEPGVIAVARKDSPIVVGVGETGSYVASDVIALIDATRDVVVLEDGQFAKLTPAGVEYTDEAGNMIEPKITHIDWDLDMAEKGGYPDFMLKEIHEQPRVVRDTLVGRMTPAGELDIDELGLSLEELNDIDRVYVIACGTSYHAGLIAKNLIEGWARIPTEVEAASEFRYRNPIITPTTLVVAVSQSGETADTLAAIRDARIKGAKVFGITNVVGSPVARESDGVIYTKANKEIAVASTKSFIGQVVSLTLLALLLAQVKYRLTTKQTRMMFRELSDTAEQIQWILDTQTEAVHEAALLCRDAQSALFVGRGMGAAISYEGALKLKEVSYLHAEAYAAGEMKHGPIALIDPGFPVIAVATKSATYDKTVSNLMECKARGAKVIVVATEGDEEINKIADCIIRVPAVRDVFSPITASVPLQLLAREVAILRGCDVDQPRNLAKSVTVEYCCSGVLPNAGTARRCAGRIHANLTFNFEGATRRSAPSHFTSPWRKCGPLAVGDWHQVFRCRNALTRRARLRCGGVGPCCICPDKTCRNKPVPFWQVSGACWSQNTWDIGPGPRFGYGTSCAGACSPKARLEGVATRDGTADLLVLVYDVLIVQNLRGGAQPAEALRLVLVASSQDHTVLRHAMPKIM